MPDVSRRQREILRTREDIVDAAARAFAKRGPRGTTIQEIAQEAGYAPAALYSYFKGKDEIFSAIFDGLTKKILATFEEPLPERLSFSQRLDLLFRHQCRVAEANQHAFLLFLTTNLEPASVDAGLLTRERGFGLYAERMTRWLEAEATDGDLVACSAADAACAFIGIGYAFFQRWFCTHGHVERGFFDQAPLIVRLFLNGIGGPQITQDGDA